MFLFFGLIGDVISMDKLYDNELKICVYFTDESMLMSFEYGKFKSGNKKTNKHITATDNNRQCVTIPIQSMQTIALIFTIDLALDTFAHRHTRARTHTHSNGRNKTASNRNFSG